MGDDLQTILYSLISLVIGLFLTYFISRIIAFFLKRLAAKTKSQTDDFIIEGVVRTIKPLGFVISASISWSLLPVDPLIDKYFLGITKLIFIVLIVRLINRSFIKIINRWAEKIDDDSISSMIRSITPMVRATTWCIGLISYLQNIGVQMAAIWALLSAGGIGAGLALKGPVEEFFEYITILIDKPFQSGQFINIDNVWAKVERVGVRSTRLRSLNGEVIVMSNSNLTNGIISNYAEMECRRLVHKIGVVYSTSYEKVKKIPEIIKTIIDNVEDSEFDRCHFVGFGNSSLDIELVYFIPTNNYSRAMAAQQEINLEIIKHFQAEGIEFAFPSQSLYIEKS